MAKDWDSIARNLRGVALSGVLRAARWLTSECEFLFRVVLRNAWPAHLIRRGSCVVKPGAIVGMVRLRNEADILADTLDHVGEIVDGIVVYCDASDDGSDEIAVQHPKVLEVVRNRRWRARGRVWEETANRRKLYQRALRYRPSWVFYADADERFDGDIRSFLTGEDGRGIAGLRVNLFDAYLTPDDCAPIRKGSTLANSRTWFGVERRRILVAWRPTPAVRYRRPDSREPQGVTGEVIALFGCQHFGKALSVEQWEDTCDYYMRYFPEVYRARWERRRGKVIHEVSDFGTELRTWRDVAAHAVDI